MNLLKQNWVLILQGGMMSEYGGFSLDINDFKKYYNNINGVQIFFYDFIKSFMYQMAERFIGIVKPKTPVDTGELRRSWQIGNIEFKSNNVEIEILNGKEYASFVENGHRGVYVPTLGVTMFTDKRFTEGRFMMRISTDIIRKYIPKAYSLEFKKYLKLKGIE